MISIVIPSRNERYLQNTIEDLIRNAKGEIEIIAVLDGYWPNPQLPDYPNLVIIHRGKALGMRPAINAAVAISKGEYILKIDAHCAVSEGYDIELIKNCEENWVVIPRRKRLDPVAWLPKDVGKPDVDYEFLSFPSDPKDFGGPGLNGKIWTERAIARKDIMIDDDMSFQGSCWFMQKSYFYELELMDDKNYGSFWNEAQEIGLKCWLSGGRVIVNKHVWYAHWHKGKIDGRGYSLDHNLLFQGSAYTKKWFEFGKAWHKQIHPLSWLIEKFNPVPTWPEDKKFMEIITLPEKRTDLALLFKGRGVEVGVERAIFSKMICTRNPETFLFLVDPWKAYKEYRDHVTQSKLDNFYQVTKERMQGLNHEIIRKFSMDALDDFQDNSLDFVYIDANHDYQHCVEDITGWYKKVKTGGIVAGHDYIRRKGQDHLYAVKKAVDDFVEVFNIPKLFIYKGDDSPSWMFYKI